MPCCRRAPCARGRAVHARWRQAQALLGVVVFSTVAVCLVYYWIAAHSRGGAAAVEVAVRQVQSQQGMCAHTLGDWCSIWLHGKVSAAPAQLLTSPGPDKPCPGNCSSIGNCDTTLGVCSCPAGETPLAACTSAQVMMCPRLIVSSCKGVGGGEDLGHAPHLIDP